MTDRTIKILGQGYNISGDCMATITVDGTQVFSGPVPTIASAPPAFQGKVDEVLTEFTVDVDFEGIKEINVTCTAGTLICGDFLSNYVFPYQLGNGPRIKKWFPGDGGPPGGRWLPLQDDPSFSKETDFGSFMPVTGNNGPESKPTDPGVTLPSHTDPDDITEAELILKPTMVKNGEEIDRTLPENITAETIKTQITWPYNRRPTQLTRLDPGEDVAIQLNVPHAWKDSMRITKAYAKSVPNAIYTEWYDPEVDVY